MSDSPFRRNSSNKEPSAHSDESINPGNSKKKDCNHINSTVKNIPDTKCIHIYLNGDEHFPGCRCVINNKYYRNLDMFLNYLTERLKPSFGAVRNIYTPVNGHPVAKLEDLISKHRYVVGGSERFKKLDFGYTTIGDNALRRYEKKPKSKFKVTKAKTVSHKSLNICLHKNGIFKEKPIQVALSQDLESWELTFKKISEVLKCDQVKRLYTLNGKPIQNIEELDTNQSYVVIEKHEVFKFGQYGIHTQNNISSNGKYIAHHRSSRKSSSVISAQSSAVNSQTLSSGVNKKHSSSNSNQIQFQDSVQDSFNISELGNGIESYSVNPFKFKQNDQNEIKINFDDDFSGIFRSKMKNHLTAGAVEIEDSLETVIDVPVDLLDAEEVEDEVTPDMERSLQHLSLDVPDKIVAYLPTIEKPNSNERQVSSKYNLNQSQTIDIHNIFV